MLSLMAKEMAKEKSKEKHLKWQHSTEIMRYEAEAALERLVDWRSGKATEELQEQGATSVKEQRYLI